MTSRLLHLPLLLLTILTTLTLLQVSPVAAQTASSSVPDPRCSRGILERGACCPRQCGTCGGAGCGTRGARLKSNCCPNSILSNTRFCDSTGAPCKLRTLPPAAPPSEADPTCKTGVSAGGACCPKRCGSCGGSMCGLRSFQQSTRCCVSGILDKSRSCNSSAPPCKLAAATPPPPTRPPPTRPPSSGPNVSTLNGAWRHARKARGPGGTIVSPVVRHEACAVMVNGLVVLIGGRGRNKAVSIYNPKTGLWVNKPGAGAAVQLHHMQCVAAAGKVWVVSSWTDGFPFEKNTDRIYVYDVASATWSTRPGLPANRRRGGAAAVRRGSWIYVVAGNRGGHGEHATALGWMDAYNYVTNKWMTNLPSLPAGAERDHVGGAMVNGQLCIAGGRDSGVKTFFTSNVKSTYCYNFTTKKWTKKDDFPVPRAGANTGSTCDGKMMIAGGEGNGRAYSRVDVFDGTSWTQAPSMVRQRHGSGLAIANCGCGQIFIPSGSGGQGGGPELDSTEQYIPKGGPIVCANY